MQEFLLLAILEFYLLLTFQQFQHTAQILFFTRNQYLLVLGSSGGQLEVFYHLLYLCFRHLHMARNIKGSCYPCKIFEALVTFQYYSQNIMFPNSHILFRFISNLLGMFLLQSCFQSYYIEIHISFIRCLLSFEAYLNDCSGQMEDKTDLYSIFFYTT